MHDLKTTFDSISLKLDQEGTFDNPADRKLIVESLNQVKSKFDKIRSGTPDDLSWENERNSLNSVINTLSQELERAKKSGKVQKLLNENKKLKNELDKYYEDNLKLKSYTNELELKLDELHSQATNKPLLAQEQEVSQQTRNLLNSYKDQTESQQAEIERLSKLLKLNRDQTIQLESSNEEQDRKNRSNEYQIRNLAERLQEIKGIVDEKENALGSLKREKDDLKRNLISKDDEIEELKNQLQMSNREINALKLPFERKNDPELVALQGENKVLEGRVHQLNDSIAKQRDAMRQSELVSQQIISQNDSLILKYKDAILEKDQTIEDLERKNRNNESQLRILNDQLEDLKKQLIMMNEIISKLKAEKEEAKTELSSKEEKIDEISAQRQSLQREINILKQTPNLEIQKTQAEFENLKSENDSLTSRVNQLSETVKKQRETISDLNNSNQELTLNNSKLLLNNKEEIVSKEQALEESERKNRLIENQIRSLTENVVELNTLLEDKDNTILQIKKDRESFKKIIKENEDLIIELEAKNSALCKELALLKRVPETSIEDKAEVEALKIEKDFLTDRLSSLSEALKQQRENVNQLEITNDDLNGQNTQLKIKIKNSEEAYNNLQSQAEDLHQKLENYNMLNKKYNESVNSLEQLKLETEQNKQQVVELKEKLRSLQDVEEEKEYLGQQCQKLKENLEKTKNELREAESKNAELFYSEETRDKLQQQNAKLNEMLEKTKSQLSENRASTFQQESEWLNERDQLLQSLNSHRKDIEELTRNSKSKDLELQELSQTAQNEKDRLHIEVVRLGDLLKSSKEKLTEYNHKISAQESAWAQEKTDLNQKLDIKDQENAELRQMLLDLKDQTEDTKKSIEEKIKLQNQVSRLSEQLNRAQREINDMIQKSALDENE